MGLLFWFLFCFFSFFGGVNTLPTLRHMVEHKCELIDGGMDTFLTVYNVVDEWESP